MDKTQKTILISFTILIILFVGFYYTFFCHSAWCMKSSEDRAKFEAKEQEGTDIGLVSLAKREKDVLICERISLDGKTGVWAEIHGMGGGYPKLIKDECYWQVVSEFRKKIEEPLSRLKAICDKISNRFVQEKCSLKLDGYVDGEGNSIYDYNNEFLCKHLNLTGSEIQILNVTIKQYCYREYIKRICGIAEDLWALEDIEGYHWVHDNCPVLIDNSVYADPDSVLNSSFCEDLPNDYNLKQECFSIYQRIGSMN